MHTPSSRGAGGAAAIQRKKPDACKRCSGLPRGFASRNDGAARVSRVERGHDNESWAATRFFHTLFRGNDNNSAIILWSNGPYRTVRAQLTAAP
jgi:hypothetical protein